MFVKERLRAAGIHLIVSLLVAALAAVLVFFVWYPYPYDKISGGGNLFWVLVAVDVAIGPMVTLFVFNPRKSRRTLALDFGVIAVLQLAALLYGLWSVFLARPVYLVFEYNRFHVVHVVDVPDDELIKAPDDLRKFPIGGPERISLRPMKETEQVGMTISALSGVSLAARPVLWQNYDLARDEINLYARPVIELEQRFPDDLAVIRKAISEAGVPAEDIGYLPVIGKKSYWTVLIDRKTAAPVAFVPLDTL